MIWPVIKIIVLTSALVAGLCAPPITLPIDYSTLEDQIFMGLVGAAVGGGGTLWFLLLHHLVWPRARKWELPTWSNGLRSPWQWLHLASMSILLMSISIEFAFFVKYGRVGSVPNSVLFGMGGGLWIGVRLGFSIFKSRIPASSCSKMSV